MQKDALPIRQAKGREDLVHTNHHLPPFSLTDKLVVLNAYLLKMIRQHRHQSIESIVYYGEHRNQNQCQYNIFTVQKINKQKPKTKSLEHLASNLLLLSTSLFIEEGLDLGRIHSHKGIQA